MAIYYVDPIDGNDTNNGTTFALRKKTLSNATTGLSSGDEVRIIASRTGNAGLGKWYTGGPSAAQTGEFTFSTGTFASTLTTVTVTFTSANHGFTTGDWIRIAAQSSFPELNGIHRITVLSPTSYSFPNKTGITRANTSLPTGSPGVSRVSNAMVRLDSTTLTKAVLWAGVPYDDAGNTVNVHAQHRATMTASTNVTFTFQHPAAVISTVPVYGNSFGRIAINATFTTGKAAYWTVPNGPLDLSLYSQLSFWMYQFSGTTASTPANLSIRLCSDTLGNVPVYTFLIPPPSSTGAWNHFLVNNAGSALMTQGINSVAIYVERDIGAIDFYLHGVIACLPPEDTACITGQTLISTKRFTNTWGKDAWWNIKGIYHNYLYIGPGNASFFQSSWGNISGNSLGYTYDNPASSTQVETTFPVYTMHPMSPSIGSLGRPMTSSTSTVEMLINSSNILVSGGWDRTNMSTRSYSDLTFIYNTSNGNGIGWRTASSVSNVILENVGASCYYTSFQNNSFARGLTFRNIYSAGSSEQSINLTSTNQGNTIYDVTICQQSSQTSNPLMDLNNAGRNHIFRDIYIKNQVAQNAGMIRISSCGDSHFRNIRLIGARGANFNSTAGAIVMGGAGGTFGTSFNRFEDIVVAGHQSSVTNQSAGLVRFIGGRSSYNTFENVTLYDCGVIATNAASGVMGTQNAIIDIDYVRTTPITLSNTDSQQFHSASSGSLAEFGISPKSQAGIQTHLSFCGGLFGSEYVSSFEGRSDVLKFVPTGCTTLNSLNAPPRYKIASIAVTGGKTVTFGGKINRKPVGASNITVPYVRFCCMPSIIGISTTGAPAVGETISSRDVWDDLSLSITPLRSGVVDLLLEFVWPTAASWGSTSLIYFDSLTVTE